jgi:hypothetical protein
MVTTSELFVFHSMISVNGNFAGNPVIELTMMLAVLPEATEPSAPPSVVCTALDE